jgi:hypothetical protein
MYCECKGRRNRDATRMFQMQLRIAALRTGRAQAHSRGKRQGNDPGNMHLLLAACSQLLILVTITAMHLAQKGVAPKASEARRATQYADARCSSNEIPLHI